MNNFKVLSVITIIAIIISIVAITISIFSMKFDTINETNYIAIAATILTGAVTFAVGYNIYINLNVTKIVAKESAEAIATNIAKIEAEKIAAPIVDRALYYSAGSGNYVSAIIYFEKGRNIDALKFCIGAKNNFEKGNHPDMVAKCDEFLDEINRRIQEQ